MNQPISRRPYPHVRIYLGSRLGVAVIEVPTIGGHVLGPDVRRLDAHLPGRDAILVELQENSLPMIFGGRHLMNMRQAAYRSPTSAKLERLEQIVDEASEDQRKVVIFSFFLHVLATVGQWLDSVVGTITGAVSPSGRQQLVDEFTRHRGHAVLLNQIEAGGVGINLQAASIVIITEPKWKPSTEDQAIARAHRMGQVRTVQVHRLLAKDSVDERIREIQENKSLLFDEYARKSDAKEVDRRAIDREWHRPAELDDAAVPLERRVILAEEHRLNTPRDALK